MKDSPILLGPEQSPQSSDRITPNASPIRIDRLIRSKRRTLALQIDAGGRLTVRAPLRLPRAEIERFVQSRAGWIRRHQQRSLAAQPPEHHYQAGERFLYLGEEYPLAIVDAVRPALELREGQFRLSRAALPRAEQLFTRWYRNQARQVFAHRADFHARRVGEHFDRLRVSSARTRWGSCSSRRTLSFTWRLVMAPPAAIDYVIIHELAHLQVHAHSHSFWGLVEAWLPEWKTAADWLKENGYRLAI
ncbi:predicted metal-dependent hydrolase [Longilinea arvoryzae]|uniref:Predicted metal-dependent hydrolase n=1 Tax=Longilinea arvoryzae TaxID=360412 RepID=A0A0S7BD20_9CHLR|nr:SprT family zinc-dependent metalloprotease [Longilinea arvoryzae]GAP13261.1 predicted metal-dependent hydrolase [Longilinea arvoryzae]